MKTEPVNNPDRVQTYADGRSGDPSKVKPLIETQAQKEAKIWAEAQKKHAEEMALSKERRDKEALDAKVIPATNPTNITSPMDHGPAAKPVVLGQGEP